MPILTIDRPWGVEYGFQVWVITLIVDTIRTTILTNIRPVQLRAHPDFERDPDSMLPAGTTGFVTAVPGATGKDKFPDVVDSYKERELEAASTWLAKHNAAWVFRDGFYALAAPNNQLEVRKLDGTPVWRGGFDPQTHRSASHALAPLRSNYTVPDETWQAIVTQQKLRERLQQQFAGAT
ncbi:hypothetical protein [Paraburkholderia sacchari]|uniref:hypothetical protein n=1 Tax=Paraburkholderia sacchari TaxID=159450 RepID=UPI0039A73D10